MRNRGRFGSSGSARTIRVLPNEELSAIELMTACMSVGSPPAYLTLLGIGSVQYAGFEGAINGNDALVLCAAPSASYPLTPRLRVCKNPCCRLYILGQSDRVCQIY